MNIGSLKNLIAGYLKRVPYDFLVNDVDTLLVAINNARRTAEKMHDFRYSETSVFLSIGANGASLAASYINSTIAVTGTLVPDVAGSWALAGTRNGAPFFTVTVSTVVYFLSFTGSAWQIRPGGFTGSNGWNLTTTSTDPSGNYVATGTSTGVAVVTAVGATVDVKRVRRVSLPIAGGDYLPVEFMTQDAWLARVRQQTGRAVYTPANTLAQSGIYQINPVAYQQAQSLLLVPVAQYTFPIVSKLDVVQFMPDYTQDSDSDFFTENAPEYLQWAAICEGNKYWKDFVARQEGNLDEPKQNADEALQSLIAWDASLSESTSTPVSTQPE